VAVRARRLRNGLPAAADEPGGPGAVRRRGFLRQVGARAVLRLCSHSALSSVLGS
jgi:hypothetical protein